MEAGIVKKLMDGIKVLGKGNLEKKLTVKAHKVSATAKEAIEAKGGSVEINNTTDDIQMEGDWEFNGDKSILTMTFDRYVSPDTSSTNANVVMYWKVLELERDDFQAYQFREYDGQDIHQYAYYLKMEKR